MLFFRNNPRQVSKNFVQVFCLLAEKIKGYSNGTFFFVVTTSGWLGQERFFMLLLLFGPDERIKKLHYIREVTTE